MGRSSAIASAMPDSGPPPIITAPTPSSATACWQATAKAFSWAGGSAETSVTVHGRIRTSVRFSATPYVSAFVLMASPSSPPSVMMTKRSATPTAIFMAASDMPNTGHDEAFRASARPGSLKAAMMIASALSWRSLTTERTAGTVAADCSTVSMNSIPDGADTTSTLSGALIRAPAMARMRALVAALMFGLIISKFIRTSDLEAK